MKTPEGMDLNNIRYLLEAADSGSFSAAARRFGAPPSLVSRRIARLEEDLGVRLFQRTTRSLTLTDAGHAFLEHARAAMQSLALAHDVLGNLQSLPSGRVRLSAPAGMAEALWSIISRFLARHPGVRVELEFADRYVDLVEERFDLAIRSGAETRSDRLIGRRLVDAPRWLFASPHYLKVHGQPRTVSDLERHVCVVIGARAERVTWSINVGKRSQNVMVGGRVAVNEARLAAKCAADVFGIAFLPLATCAEYLTAGKLQRVLPHASGGERGLWLVYPDRHLPAASRALAEVIVSELPATVAALTSSKNFKRMRLRAESSSAPSK
jgi:DNA-binding transcriptional LysR family regulator